MLDRFPRHAGLKRFLSVLFWSRLGLLGLALSLVSGIVLLILLAAELLGQGNGPYSGILSLLILPGFFTLGLLLMPVGYLRARRRLPAAPEGQTFDRSYPILDFNRPALRRNLIVFFLLTLLNLGILGLTSYHAVGYMESTEFCGRACHSVMGPEFSAYHVSPHARVPCVGCHVGPGVPGFVRSKLTGVRQLASIVRHSYSQPIPTPVENLRPARETCERCHWPEKWQGDRIKILTKYDQDEASTELKTVLVVHVGGGTRSGGAGSGIHWHMNIANEITYIASDRERLVIPWVRLKDRAGKVSEYVASGATLAPERIRNAPRRTMDCVDCHNRPAHDFKTAEEAADDAIQSKGLDRGLPFLKKQMVIALRGTYLDRPSGLRRIEEFLDGYYRDQHPEVYARSREPLRTAVRAAQEAYSTYCFPEMGVTWGVYPNHLGHERFPGCFRCHDSDHRTADGREISQDCDTCHTLLANEEADPAILKALSGQP